MGKKSSGRVKRRKTRDPRKAPLLDIGIGKAKPGAAVAAPEIGVAALLGTAMPMTAAAVAAAVRGKEARPGLPGGLSAASDAPRIEHPDQGLSAAPIGHLFDGTEGGDGAKGGAAPAAGQ